MQKVRIWLANPLPNHMQTKQLTSGVKFDRLRINSEWENASPEAPECTLNSLIQVSKWGTAKEAVLFLH